MMCFDACDDRTFPALLQNQFGRFGSRTKESRPRELGNFSPKGVVFVPDDTRVISRPLCSIPRQKIINPNRFRDVLHLIPNISPARPKLRVPSRERSPVAFVKTNCSLCEKQGTVHVRRSTLKLFSEFTMPRLSY